VRPPASAWLGSSRLVYGTQPIIAANWKVSQHNTWAVPFGWAFGDAIIGTLPINTRLGVCYNLIRPQDSRYAKWPCDFRRHY
jgi:hypothetical protein